MARQHTYRRVMSSNDKVPNTGDRWKQLGSELLDVFIESFNFPAALIDNTDRSTESEPVVALVSDSNGCDASELNLESHRRIS